MRYLVALSEHKHFGRAAQACHITQPALSNALRSLESEFGVVIVKRARVYVGLTHEGERSAFDNAGCVMWQACAARPKCLCSLSATR